MDETSRTKATGTPDQVQAALEAIRKVREDAAILEETVDELSGGTRDNILYREMNETLERKLVELDAVPSDGDNEIRDKRKRCVEYIQRCIDKLEAKYPDVDCDMAFETSNICNGVQMRGEQNQNQGTCQDGDAISYVMMPEQTYQIQLRNLLIHWFHQNKPVKGWSKFQKQQFHKSQVKRFDVMYQRAKKHFFENARQLEECYEQIEEDYKKFKTNEFQAERKDFKAFLEEVSSPKLRDYIKWLRKTSNGGLLVEPNDNDEYPSARKGNGNIESILRNQESTLQQILPDAVNAKFNLPYKCPLVEDESNIVDQSYTLRWNPIYYDVTYKVFLQFLNIIGRKKLEGIPNPPPEIRSNNVCKFRYIQYIDNLHSTTNEEFLLALISSYGIEARNYPAKVVELLYNRNLLKKLQKSQVTTISASSTQRKGVPIPIATVTPQVPDEDSHPSTVIICNSTTTTITTDNSAAVSAERSANNMSIPRNSAVNYGPPPPKNPRLGNPGASQSQPEGSSNTSSRQSSVGSVPSLVTMSTSQTVAASSNASMERIDSGEREITYPFNVMKEASQQILNWYGLNKNFIFDEHQWYNSILKHIQQNHANLVKCMDQVFKDYDLAEHEELEIPIQTLYKDKTSISPKMLSLRMQLRKGKTTLQSELFNPMTAERNDSGEEQPDFWNPLNLDFPCMVFQRHLRWTDGKQNKTIGRFKGLASRLRYLEYMHSIGKSNNEFLLALISAFNVRIETYPSRIIQLLFERDLLRNRNNYLSLNIVPVSEVYCSIRPVRRSLERSEDHGCAHQSNEVASIHLGADLSRCSISPAGQSGTSVSSITSNSNASTPPADPLPGNSFYSQYTRPAKRKVNMDSSISQKEDPLPIHLTSFYSIPFEAWKPICQSTRIKLQNSGLVTSRIKTLSEEDYRVLYVRYLNHVEKNYSAFIQGLVTAYPDVDVPEEVYNLIKAKEQCLIRGQTSSESETQSVAGASSIGFGTSNRMNGNESPSLFNIPFPRYADDDDFEVVDYEHGKRPEGRRQP